MVHSLPILGSVIQGNDLRDMIQDAKAGCILNNGDDLDFYRAAKELASNELLRIQTGKYANQLLLEKFSVDSAATQIIASLSNGK
ncbi:MAG: hypothetical protein KAH18_11710 [Psychromonas sp.]|nr:hypothetical protein [Psychromonas sp.]